MTRPFKANILKFMAPLSFVLASLAIYWAMWPTTAEVIFIIILGLPIYFFYEYKMNWKTLKQIGGSLWIIIYLVVLAFLSFIGVKNSGYELDSLPMGFLSYRNCSFNLLSIRYNKLLRKYLLQTCQ